jgi:hypothetical protein
VLDVWVHAQPPPGFDAVIPVSVTGPFASRDRRFRNLPKSVTFDRKERSRSAETGGHGAPKSAVTIDRNTQQAPREIQEEAFRQGLIPYIP